VACATSGDFLHCSFHQNVSGIKLRWAHRLGNLYPVRMRLARCQFGKATRRRIYNVVDRVFTLVASRS
jgi:hypothetical protein